MKVCARCGNKGEFFADKKAKDGLQSQCKKCKSDYICNYYKLNKEKRFKKSKEQLRENYHKNKIVRNKSRSILLRLLFTMKSLLGPVQFFRPAALLDIYFLAFAKVVAQC